MSGMRQAGRANWLMIAGGLGVIAVIILLFLSSESPSNVAEKFMEALAKGDVSKLTELSLVEPGQKELLKRQWEYCVNVAGPYYRFQWKVLSEKESDPKNAAVSLFVWRDALSPSTFEERFALPMVKTNSGWKVDYHGINREMYPGLPR